MAGAKRFSAFLLALGMAVVSGGAAIPVFAEEAATSEIAATPETASLMGAGGTGGSGFALQPLSAAYLDYLENGAMGDYIPSPVDAGLFGTPRSANFNLYSLPPAKFDLRTEGLVTEVKNQNVNGACWSFAAIASIESGLVAQYPWVDLSERHLVFSSFQFDDGLLAPDPNPSSWGGWNQVSTGTLSHFFGPVAENRYPYEDYTGITKQDRAEAEFHLQDVSYLPQYPYELGSDRVDGSILKALLQERGALSIAYCDVGTNTDTEHASYYNPEPAYANHQVTLVGWDDTFPKENFLTEAPGDGAWLIKNSWGTNLNFQKGGYFWLSYYDATLSDGAFYEVSEENADRQAYYYDSTGWGLNLAFSTPGAESIQAANVFTNPTAAQQLEAVGLYTGASNVAAGVSVYLMDDTGNWAATPAATVTESEPYAGYHTLTLDTPVPLGAGQKYTVVYTATPTDADADPLMPVEIKCDAMVNSLQAEVNAGETYYYDPDTNLWTDATAFEPFDMVGTDQKIYLGNACITALVAPSGPAAPEPAAPALGETQAVLSSLMVSNNDRTTVPLQVFGTASGTTTNAPEVITEPETPEGLQAGQTLFIWPISTGEVRVNGIPAEYTDGLYHPTAVENLQAGKTTVTIEVSETGKTTTDYELTFEVAASPTPTSSASPIPTPSASPTPTPSASPIPTPTLPPVEIIEGGNQNVARGATLTVRSSAEFKDYLNTEVDGKQVPAGEVETKAGSTIVTLSANYLQGLAVGTHTVRINSTTGSAETQFQCLSGSSGTGNTHNNTPATPAPAAQQTAAQISASIPQTADASEPLVWVVLLLASLSVGAVLVCRKRNHH